MNSISQVLNLRILKTLSAMACMGVLTGCSTDKSETFTFTADLPPNFYYQAAAVYVPAKGETCTVPGGKNTHVGYNRHWPKDYKNDSIVALYRTVSGCPLVISSIRLKIYGIYGEDRDDYSGSNATVVTREVIPPEFKKEFDPAGVSAFYGRCKWYFRTIGKTRVLRKLLICKDTDAEGNLTLGYPWAPYALNQLPGKTVKIKITLDKEEKPYMKDTWVKVPNGWKRCMGKSFEDQSAFCYGNYKDFSGYIMPDGKQCTIYPGCTE